MHVATKDLQKLIEQANSLSSLNTYFRTDKGVHFGLTGSLKLIDNITDENNRRVAETLVLNHYIKNRSPELYTRMEQDLKRKVEESRQGKNQHSLRAFAQQIENATAKNRLGELTAIFNLQPTKIGDGPTILLPELEDSETYQIPASIYNITQDLEAEELGLEDFLNFVSEKYLEGIQCLLEEKTYIPNISERFLTASTHYSIIEYIRESEGVNLPDFADITYFNEVRAAMPQAPGVENAIRIQLKENPEYGKQLDEEFNKLVLTSVQEVDKRLGKRVKQTPSLIIDNKLVTIPYIGNA